jgi:hypothetical protein
MKLVKKCGMGLGMPNKMRDDTEAVYKCEIVRESTFCPVTKCDKPMLKHLIQPLACYNNE